MEGTGNVDAAGSAESVVGLDWAAHKDAESLHKCLG